MRPDLDLPHYYDHCMCCYSLAISYNMKKHQVCSRKLCMCGCYNVLVLVALVLLIRVMPQVNSCDTEYSTFLISDDAEDGNFTSLEDLHMYLTDGNLTGHAIAVRIGKPMLTLTEKITFSDYSCVMITALSPETTITCSSTTNAGIVLENVTSLTVLSNLKFVSCGAQLDANSSLYKSYSYFSAIILHNSSGVEILNITVSKTNGVGLMILGHTGGNITVLSSVFEGNSITSESNKDRTRLGGGGVYVGRFGMQDDDEICMYIKFENCTFENNTANTRHYRYIFTDVTGGVIEGYGRGGGLFLAFEQRAYSSNVSVTISDCKFIGNQAFIGSGLSVKIGEVERQSIEVFVKETQFENNGCNNSWLSKDAALGGGAHFSFNSYENSIIYSNITLQNVEFSQNCAKHGGGVFVYSHKQDSDKTSNTLLFDECNFFGNKALSGSAMDISPNIFKRLSSGYTITPTLRNCQFWENSVYVSTGNYSTGIQRNPGIGTVYVSLCDITFEGYAHFENNSGTATYVVNGNIDFQNSSVTFKNNIGVDGGAVALLGAASMIVGPNQTYVFDSNRALHRGGALFVQLIDDHDFSLSRSCFFQYRNEKEDFTPLLATSWDSNITFTRNGAKLGKSIFATSLYPCQVINNGSDKHPFYVNVDIATAFEGRGISFDNERNISVHIATDGGRLVKEDDTTSVKSHQLRLIPGRYSNHGIKVYNDLNVAVSEPLRTTLSDAECARNKIKLDKESSFFVRDRVRLFGEPGERATLSFQVASFRQAYITMTVELLDCPPGYILRDDQCKCDAASYVGLLNCDNYHSYLTPAFWAGMVEDENVPPNSKPQLATSPCPLGYCHAPANSTKVRLPQSSDSLEQVICGESNRKGVLCGSCQKNYTVYFHALNSSCRREENCHIGWLLYIVSELIPVTLVFVTILVLNISFTSGAVNGFILFSQLLVSIDINASGIIQLPEGPIKSLQLGYKIIYGLFNLDFFPGDSTSFCLWEDASTLDVIAFKYVTIVYALLLILFFVWFMNWCGGRCLGKWCRITTIKSSVIHGISAFLIICYSQALRTSLYLLNGHKLDLRKSHNQSEFKLTKRVWLNGELTCFGKMHLPYAIPALFSLIFMGILPPLLLLMYPLLNKVLDIFKLGDTKVMIFFFKWIIPINRLKPLLDSFQGCFKDNMRFFAGLYFLYRGTALVSYTVSSDFSFSYISTQVFFIFFLILHALCHPYIKRAHNIIDTFLFANLVLINFITLLQYMAFRNEETKSLYGNYIKNPAYIQLVLIYIPIAIFVVYIFVQVYNQLSSWYFGRKKSINNSSNNNTDGNNINMIMGTLLRNINSFSKHKKSKVDDELPHRLLADSVSCDCFEDSECTENGFYMKSESIFATK